MDSQSLGNVLSILRLIKKEQTGFSGAQLIQNWVGDGSSDQTILRVASYVIEQVDLARIAISASQLSQEAKDGVLSTLNTLVAVFSLQGIHSAWSSHLKDISASISNLVILLSALEIEATQLPDDATNLVAEIKAVMDQFDDPQLDPLVRDVAKKHLQVLSTLLQHIPIFGMEAAMTSYFEMIVKLRRVDSGASEEAHKQTQPLWDKIKQWGPRMEALDKQINTGVRLLGHAKKAFGLLDYIPM